MMWRLIERLLPPTLAALALAVSGPQECRGDAPAPATQMAAADARLELGGVFGLLDVLDLIVQKHPDHVAEARRMQEMGETERREALDAKVAATAADKEIERRIDALYATPAYRMYFRQFRNVTPEAHRRILHALPYSAIPSPGDISYNLRELCLNREAVRGWVSGALTRIDLGRCRDAAAAWLPPGEYSIPTVRFIYDGNGDAFAREGEVCFDLYSLVFRERPPGSRFHALSEVDGARIERVIAHEFHHVYAAPLRRSGAWTSGNRTADRKLKLASRIVSEGVAMRCDVREGMRRDAMEDSATVAFWIGELNEKLALLEQGTLDDEQWERWHSSTYHDLARERLRDFLVRTYPGQDVEALLREHPSARPSLVYTLGWWMISRILEGPDGRERVLSLLSQPDRLFERYDEAMGEGPVAFRVRGR